MVIFWKDKELVNFEKALLNRDVKKLISITGNFHDRPEKIKKVFKNKKSFKKVEQSFFLKAMCSLGEFGFKDEVEKINPDEISISEAIFLAHAQLNVFSYKAFETIDYVIKKIENKSDEVSVFDIFMNSLRKDIQRHSSKLYYRISSNHYPLPQFLKHHYTNPPLKRFGSSLTSNGFLRMDFSKNIGNLHCIVTYTENENLIAFGSSNLDFEEFPIQVEHQQKYNHYVSIIEKKSGNCISITPSLTNQIRSIAFHPEEPCIAIGMSYHNGGSGHNGGAVVWDWENNRLLDLYDEDTGCEHVEYLNGKIRVITPPRDDWHLEEFDCDDYDPYFDGDSENYEKNDKHYRSNFEHILEIKSESIKSLKFLEPKSRFELGISKEIKKTEALERLKKVLPTTSANSLLSFKWIDRDHYCLSNECNLIEIWNVCGKCIYSLPSGEAEVVGGDIYIRDKNIYFLKVLPMIGIFYSRTQLIKITDFKKSECLFSLLGQFRMTCSLNNHWIYGTGFEGKDEVYQIIEDRIVHAFSLENKCNRGSSFIFSNNDFYYFKSFLPKEKIQAKKSNIKSLVKVHDLSSEFENVLSCEWENLGGYYEIEQMASCITGDIFITSFGVKDADYFLDIIDLKTKLVIKRLGIASKIIRMIPSPEKGVIYFLQGNGNLGVLEVSKNYDYFERELYDNGEAKKIVRFDFFENDAYVGTTDSNIYKLTK